jgi:hypothetical protein
MPSLLRDTECRACGHRHHFCLVSDNVAPGREYTYVCPETAKKATLRPTSTAEVVQSPPQGAVALTPALYDAPRGAGHESAEGTRSEQQRQQTQLRRPSESPATAATGLPAIKREVQEIGREMQGLAARVGELEQKAATAPRTATAPAAALPAAANEPEAGATRLQEVLPEVKELAGKVGGLRQLSDIVETLKEAKKE